jgi:hypothetical protein
MGLEPTPGPWQGPVLPLYYGRPNQQDFITPANRRQDESGTPAPQSNRRYTPAIGQDRSGVHENRAEAVGSADLQHPGGLDDRGLALPLREFRGLLPIGVHASKPLPVLVEHGNLPVPVLAPTIFSEFGAFACGFCLGHGLNISTTLRARKYQFDQYFAQNGIITYYHPSCNGERQFICD